MPRQTLLRVFSSSPARRTTESYVSRPSTTALTRMTAKMKRLNAVESARSAHARTIRERLSWASRSSVDGRHRFAAHGSSRARSHHGGGRADRRQTEA
jgi:hypothetical protein